MSDWVQIKIYKKLSFWSVKSAEIPIFHSMSTIVFHLPSAGNLKNALENVVSSAHGAVKLGSWEMTCTEYKSFSSSSLSKSTSSKSPITSTTPSSTIWRCTTSSNPNVCCFVHNNHALIGPYSDSEPTRSLEQFIINDKSDRYRESSAWSVQGVAIALENFSFRIGTLSLSGTTDVYDGVCFSIACNDAGSSQTEHFDQIKKICCNIEAALKEHFVGQNSTTSNDGNGDENETLTVPQLSNFDVEKIVQIQKQFNLPEQSPLRYEALQMLEIVTNVRKEKNK